MPSSTLNIGHGHHMVPAFQVAGAVEFCARGEIDEKGRIDANGTKASKSLTTSSPVTRNNYCYSFDRSHSFHLHPHTITHGDNNNNVASCSRKFELNNLGMLDNFFSKCQLQLYTAILYRRMLSDLIERNQNTDIRMLSHLFIF